MLFNFLKTEKSRLEAENITFSQCVHWPSKSRLEAAALVFTLAFFALITQLFIKLHEKIKYSSEKCIEHFYKRKKRKTRN
jgi:hypothetical protein